MAKRKKWLKGGGGVCPGAGRIRVFWLLLVGCLWFLVSPAELRMEAQNKVEGKHSVYFEMFKILSRFKPGIDYNQLHAVYRAKAKAAPFVFVETNTCLYFSRPRGDGSNRYAIATVNGQGRESPLIFRLVR
jgi:hypothetical protein